MKNTIIICESGWILVGVKENIEAGVRLEDSSVVRCWNNGRGIGALSKEKYKDEYTLDAIGTVIINSNKILFEIPCEW